MWWRDRLAESLAISMPAFMDASLSADKLRGEPARGPPLPRAGRLGRVAWDRVAWDRVAWDRVAWDRVAWVDAPGPMPGIDRRQQELQMSADTAH